MATARRGGNPDHEMMRNAPDELAPRAKRRQPSECKTCFESAHHARHPTNGLGRLCGFGMALCDTTMMPAPTSAGAALRGNS